MQGRQVQGQPKSIPATRRPKRPVVGIETNRKRAEALDELGLQAHGAVEVHLVIVSLLRPKALPPVEVFKEDRTEQEAAA